MEEFIGFCSVCGNASKLLRMIFHNNKWYCRECFYKAVEERECKTCKNPYCSRTMEERQKQEVQHHFQYGWECSDKEKYLQDDGGFVLVKKEEIAELKNRDCWKSCEYANPKAELIGQHIKDVQNLTKAKDHIKKLLDCLQQDTNDPQTNYYVVQYMTEAEQFLSEVEK